MQFGRRLHPAIWIFALSLLVRGVWTYASALELLGDFYCYEQSAQHWVETGEYRLLPWGVGPLVANRPPGYTGFVALNYLVFGRDIKAVGYVQAVLGAVTSALIVLLASRIVSRRAAICAGLLHVFWLPAVAYVPILASVNVALPALFGSLVLTQHAERKSGSGRYIRIAFAGVLFGTMLLVRSITLFILPAWLLLIMRGAVGHRRRLTSVLVGMFAVGLTLSPWFVRNYLIGYGFPTFATQGGRVIWWGNNPRTIDGGTGSPPTTSEEWALPEQESQVVWRNKGIDWVRNNPGRYAALCATRLIRIFGTEIDIWLLRYLDPRPAAQEAMGARNWHIKTGSPATEQQIQYAVELLGRNATCARIWRVIFAPLILLAFILALCRARQYIYVLLPLGSYIAGMTLTAFAERYRILSDPLLLILFAALLCDIATGSNDLGKWPSRSWKIVLAIGLLLASITVRVTAIDEAWYELPAIPHPAPDVSQYTFTEIDLHAESGARCFAVRYTDFRQVEDGVRCDVGRPEQKDVSAYGGASIPVPGLDALRMEISFDEPQNIVVVFFDAVDESDQRVWRWIWQERASGYNRPSAQRQTYVFVRGEQTAHFRPLGKHAEVPIKEVRVMIRVKPGTRAGFVLHHVEVAAESAPLIPND